MTRNLEPGLEPQAHVRVRMYRYSGATMYPRPIKFKNIADSTVIL
jgi:hypothetical protein